jgi:hypothetical protein
MARNRMKPCKRLRPPDRPLERGPVRAVRATGWLEALFSSASRDLRRFDLQAIMGLRLDAGDLKPVKMRCNKL